MSNYPFFMGQYIVHTLQLVSKHITTPIPEHSHGINSYEIHYIESGYGILIANNSRYELSPGTLYITGPHIFHAQLTSENDPMLETCVFYKISTASGRNDEITPLYKEEQSVLQTFLSHPFWIGQASNNLSSVLMSLLQEAANNTADSELLAASYLKLLMILIARNLKNEKELSMTAKGVDLNNQRYLIIDQAFLNHYKSITLDSISKKIGLSKRQTQRLLTQYYGMDFNQKRLQARIAISKLMLRSTNTPIYEIAEQVGYSSTEHFCNVFKREVGVTALKYRKSLTPL